jgi:hypothetical protein
MAVDRQMTPAIIGPGIFLVDFHAYQMRHELGEPAVVIAFNPDYLDATLGIGELAHVTENVPA